MNVLLEEITKSDQCPSCDDLGVLLGFTWTPDANFI